MLPEAGGSWFLLCVEPNREIIDSDIAKSINTFELKAQMKLDGIEPVLSENGAWKALNFAEDFSPYSVPKSIKLLASYIDKHMVLTLDNGCLPSIEWHFNSKEVTLFDTDDY